MAATQKQTQSDNVKELMRHERMFRCMMQNGAINMAEYRRIMRTHLLAVGMVSEENLVTDPSVSDPFLRQLLQALTRVVETEMLCNGQEIFWVDVARIEKYLERALQPLPDTRLLALHLKSAMPVLKRSGLKLAHATVKRVLRDAQLTYPELVVVRGVRLRFGSQSNRYRAHVLDWTQVLAFAADQHTVT